MQTASDAEGRYRAKSLLVRGLYDLGYNAEQVREIFSLIDRMMHLRPDLEVRFGAELSEFEEQRQMPYVTSMERLAEARGEARGETRGKSSVVLRQLARFCGELPEEQQEQVRHLATDQLDLLADDLFQFKSPSDLETWLIQHAVANE